MKSVCRAAACCAALAGASLAARGNDAPPVTLAPAPASSLQPATALPASGPSPSADGNVGPALDTDADAEAVMQRAADLREENLRADAQAASDAAARRQAYANDWMLRGYTEQLNADGLDTSADREAAAAQQVPDPTASHNQADPLSTSTDSDNPPPAPKPPVPADDAKTEAPADGAPPPISLPPLLPVVNSDGTKGVTRLDAWGSTTTFDPVPAPANPGLTAPENQDLAGPVDPDSSLDVPGLTAAREGLGDPLDAPDPQAEAVLENRTNRAKDDFLLPTVASNDSSEFFKRQSEALAAPNTPPRAALALPLSRPILPPNAPPKMLPPTGIRSHVADPFDIIGGPRY